MGETSFPVATTGWGVAFCLLGVVSSVFSSRFGTGGGLLEPDLDDEGTGATTAAVVVAVAVAVGEALAFSADEGTAAETSLS